MKHFHQFIILNLLFCFNLSAQLQLGCDCTTRYQSEIFDNTNKETVTYSDIHDLQMDIYTPEGDLCTNRPVLIFAHGGTFIFGNKNNSTVVNLCESFAKRGYVTASINYRLAGDLLGFLQAFTFYTDTEDAYNVVLNAVMDGKAAIRYFRKNFSENGNLYGIDPNQIWGGGNSAGGVLFLHAGHVATAEEFVNPLDVDRALIAQGIIDGFDGGIEGDSGNPGYSSELAGVISLAGALHRAEYVDESDVPSVFCHGDADGVVPYDCNGFQNNPIYDQLCGGGALYPEFQSLGITTDLLTFPNDDHCPWDGSTSKMNQVIEFVSDFIYQNIDCDLNNVEQSNIINQKEIYKLDILGRPVSVQKGFTFTVYQDGSVKKEYTYK